MLIHDSGPGPVFSSRRRGPPFTDPGGESDFEPALEKLLRRRFHAREYFVRLFGPDYAGARLGRFVTKPRRRL